MGPSTPGVRRERLWEVDVARTLAIVMMVTYHAAWDVSTLAPETGVDAFSGGWRALQVATGSSFLFLVGLSFSIASDRAAGRGVTPGAIALRRARRAGVVLAMALGVTVVTWFALGDDYIRFGILHVIGVSMLLAIPASRLGILTLPAGVAVIITGLWLEGERWGTSFLIPLGFRPEDGNLGVDYYGLLPWFGVVLIGMAAARVLYPGGDRAPFLRRLAAAPERPVRELGRPGRHALGIYVVHQLVLFPVVAAVLWLMGYDVSLTDI